MYKTPTKKITIALQYITRSLQEFVTILLTRVRQRI